MDIRNEMLRRLRNPRHGYTLEPLTYTQLRPHHTLKKLRYPVVR